MVAADDAGGFVGLGVTAADDVVDDAGTVVG